MALTRYQQITRRLLGNDQTFARFNDADLKDWINIARGQVAAEGECIRARGTLAVNTPSQEYAFTAISYSNAAIHGTINARMLTYNLPGTSGDVRMTAREWEFFNTFVLAKPIPTAGPPGIWAQLGQGASGTLWLNLLDGPYTVHVDGVCYPIDLVDDSTAEAVPYLWTDAIPYYAAYMAFITASNQEAAQAMFQVYQQFVARARAFATPSVLPHQYAQAPDLQMAGRLGIVSRAGGGGAGGA